MACIQEGVYHIEKGSSNWDPENCEIVILGIGCPEGRFDLEDFKDSNGIE